MNPDLLLNNSHKIRIAKQAVSQLQGKQKGQQAVGQIGHRRGFYIFTEYALSNINKPIGVSEYRLTESIPDTFKGSLPTIEQIEAELGGER